MGGKPSMEGSKTALTPVRDSDVQDSFIQGMGDTDASHSTLRA